MPETILIVDDEYANRFLLEQILYEFETVALSSADEMWKYLIKKPADLILLDVMMPDSDGFETAKELRSKSEYAGIPIIFVTARGEAEDLTRGFDLGGYDYVKKPFDGTELLVRVKSALKKSSAQKVLNDFAFRDTLTELYNRRHLELLIRNESDKINRGLLNMSAAMCDIDFFKSFNDTYGHSCGDYILKTFSRTILRSLRTYDAAIRYGGEEFLIIFPHLDKLDAEKAIERLKSIHEKTEYRFEGKTLSFMFSAGIADSSECVRSLAILDDLIQLADSRLYIAKNTGRNRIIVLDE